MESEGMGREEVCAIISSLPGQLSQEDVEDFFSLAHYYAVRTPQSFRKVPHTQQTSLLTHTLPSLARTTTASCLAVDAAEQL